jgi:hypothetical protein
MSPNVEIKFYKVFLKFIVTWFLPIPLFQTPHAKITKVAFNIEATS